MELMSKDYQIKKGYNKTPYFILSMDIKPINRLIYQRLFNLCMYSKLNDNGFKFCIHSKEKLAKYLKVERHSIDFKELVDHGLIAIEKIGRTFKIFVYVPDEIENDKSFIDMCLDNNDWIDINYD